MFSNIEHTVRSLVSCCVNIDETDQLPVSDLAPSELPTDTSCHAGLQAPYGDLAPPDVQHMFLTSQQNNMITYFV